MTTFYTAATLPWPTLVESAEPRIHPNGFIQLDVDDVTRLHVWPDVQLRPPVPFAIHDHSFTFYSRVIEGAIVNRVWMVEPDAAGPFEVYRAQMVGVVDTRLQPTGERVSVWMLMEDALPTGVGYVLPMRVYHDTTWRGLAATIMTKLDVDESHPPRVLVSTSGKPDYRDDRAVSADERAVIRDVLARLRSRCEPVVSV